MGNFYRIMWMFAAVILLNHCGSGGGSGDCSFTTLSTPSVDLDGTVWTLSGTTPTNDCPAPTTSFSGSGTFSQSSNTLTASSSGMSVTGQISGSQIKWGGTLTLGSETITVSCTTMSVSTIAVGDTMTFSSAAWTSDFGSGTCSGTASGTFTRTK